MTNCSQVILYAKTRGSDTPFQDIFTWLTKGHELEYCYELDARGDQKTDSDYFFNIPARSRSVISEVAAIVEELLLSRLS